MDKINIEEILTQPPLGALEVLPARGSHHSEKKIVASERFTGWKAERESQ